MCVMETKLGKILILPIQCFVVVLFFIVGFCIWYRSRLHTEYDEMKRGYARACREEKGGVG